MEATERIPRMRTAAKIVAEIKALDPDTEVTEFHIRKLAKDGTVPVVWAGRKALINLDDVLELMRAGTSRTEPPPCTAGSIRRIDVKRPTKESPVSVRLAAEQRRDGETPRRG